jgi:alkylation response protein AidB-like acyl-CoA dehydrogenase
METTTETLPGTTNPVRATEAAVLAAADRIAAEATGRSDEIEALGTVPLDLVQRIRADHLFRLAQPRALGGLELEPLTILRTLEALCHADASVGWTAMIGNSTFFFAYLDPDVARGLIGDGDVLPSGVFAPTGRATAGRPGGPFTVDGRWTFNSGVSHADWHIQGVLMADGPGPAPRIREDGEPDWRFAYLPHAPARGTVEIVENWNVLGLRGTGSHDLEVHGVPVAEEHLVLPFESEAPHDGPLWRLPFLGLLGVMMSAVPLGIGRRALDEILALAPERARAGRPAPIATDVGVQERLGQAEARLLAARTLVEDTIGALWTTACRGDRPSELESRRLHIAMVNAMDAATHVVDTAYALAGGRAVYDGNAVQRCFRDIHTASHHLAFSTDVYRWWARDRMGIEGS